MNNKQQIQIFRYFKNDIKHLKNNCYLTDTDNIIYYKKMCDITINEINTAIKILNKKTIKNEKIQ